MQDYLVKAIEELEGCAKDVTDILLQHYSQERIDGMLKNMGNEEHCKEMPGCLYLSLNGLRITKSILSYITEIPNELVNKDVIELCMHFWHAGFSIGASLPSISSAVYENMYNTDGIKTISKKATDVKYAPGRDIYKEAITVAKGLWENGSVIKHHKMKLYLIKEYEMEGKKPFSRFDPNCGYTEKGLLERLKQLAKDMNRPDLISGFPATKVI